MRDKITAIIFLIFILVFGIGFLLLPDREFSEMENRKLSQCPVFSVSSFLKGDYTADFEAYMSDQMLLKDTLVTVKVDTVKAMGHRLVNGVFFGADGYLIQQYGKPGEQLQENIGHIKAFAESAGLPVTFLLSPNVSEIYPEKLPALAACYSQKEVISSVKGELEGSLSFVDATDTLLAHKSEDLFFKTDHHWNMKGAYYGYEALMESLGLSTKPLSEYEETEGSGAFYGSLYSKAPSGSQVSDILTLYKNPNGEYLVNYVQEADTAENLFALENLEIKDKYTVFLDGNHPYITIDSNAEEKENVLVLKDSYAHALLPFLADSFGHLEILDLRYFHNDLKQFIEEHQIDRVIMIYNVDFLSSDVNFLWLD